MAGLLFTHAQRTQIVNMNDIQFQAFDGSTTAIGTKDLRSCSVVLIASCTGANLTHIPPPSNAHATQMMRSIHSNISAREEDALSL